MNSTTTLRPLALIVFLSALVLMESKPAPAEVWAACGIRDKEAKVVRSFPRTKFVIPGRSVSSGTTDLTCGNEKYGYRHIKKEHQTDWENQAALASMNWRDLADFGIEIALSDPDIMMDNVKEGKLCFSRQIWLFRKNNGSIVGSTFATVAIRTSDMGIISAYPAKSRLKSCGFR